MQRFSNLSTGPKLVLVSAPLLFVSLFFTWQNAEVDYGRAGRAVLPLDGWDAWGLLVGLGALVLTALVVFLHLTDVELAEDVPWERLLLAGGLALLAVTVVKVLRDADSAWASYAGVLLAALVALGTYESWAEWAGRPSLVARIRRRGRLSSAA